ncbi:MAG: TonB-dependent siderophore receptor [Rhizobacter sp.]|nr:TonB-dependent siderophore receptor [Rhizobacter sp.]
MKSYSMGPKAGRRMMTGVAMAIAAWPTAYAQTSPTPPSASASSPAAAQLSPIRVTAEPTSDAVKVDESASSKFTAPLLDTPKSVTVIPATVIRQTGSTSLVEALRTVPGITFGAGEGGNPLGDRPFIRGFDSQSDTYIDGVRDLGSASREIFDLEQVEVTKGPSGAYGGGGSTGGSLNLISKMPKANNFSEATIGLGTDSYRRVTLDVNRRLSEGVAARLNVMTHDADVAGRDFVNNSRWGIAPSLTLGIDSPTRVTLSYYHLKTDDLPDSGIPYNNPFAAGTPNARLNGDGRPIDVDRNTFYGLANRDFRRTETDIGTVSIEHDISPSMTLRNITRYSKSSNDYVWTQPDDSKGNFALTDTIWRRANTRKSELSSITNQTSLGGNFELAGLKHTYALGLELSRANSDRDSYNVPTGSNSCASGAGAAGGYNCTTVDNPNANDPWVGAYGLANRPTHSNGNNRSVYAFDTIDLTDKWLLNVGVRWDRYFSASRAPAYLAYTTPSGAAVAATTAFDYSNTSSFYNYQVGVVYKLQPNASVYASYSTSSDPAGLNISDSSTGTLSAAIQSLDPERSKSFELGAKWDVLDRRLALSGAVFHTEKSNARVTQADGSTQLAGDYKVDGIELGAAGKITEQWQVFGGYTHLKSEVVNNGTSVANAAFVGNQFANVPKDSFSLFTNYQLMPRLSVGGGAYYMARVYGNVANTKFVPGYTRFDATASYVVNENVTLQLNIQNLTDKVYYDKAFASHYASMAAGRSAFITANLKY